jgi:sterol desaturase/sphingolipid hydroxylase (fatty acid hydroxylase superfamily)
LIVRAKDHFGVERLAFNAASTVVYLTVDAAFGLWVGWRLMGFVTELPGAGFLPISMGAQPSLLLVLLGGLLWFVVRDFVYYWWHRAQHRFAWLWAIHAVHHSDPHLNVTTTTRAHWLEAPLRMITVMAPVAYICAPAPSLIMGTWLVDIFISHWSHADLPVGFGRWNRIIPAPQSHRIHHSALPQHRDRNFALMPIWDVVFGTFYAAGREEYPPTGLIGSPSPEPFWWASLWPMRTWVTWLRRKPAIPVTLPPAAQV